MLCPNTRKYYQREALAGLKMRLTKTGIGRYLFEQGSFELLSTVKRCSVLLSQDYSLLNIPDAALRSLLIKEAKFVIRILERCCASRGPMILFWDVDDTLGAYSRWGNDTPWAARPSSMYLLELIKRLYPLIKHGVISMRTHEGLHQAIYDDKHPLHFLSPYVERNLIYGRPVDQSLYLGEHCREFKLGVLSAVGQKNHCQAMLIDDLDELRGDSPVVWVGDLRAPDMYGALGPYLGCSVDSE